LIDLSKLKQGDPAEWEELVEQTSPKMLALFGSMLGLPNEQCRELVSDVYVKAFKNIQSFRGDAKVTTWLSTIATNIARDYIRARAKQDAHIPIEDEHAITNAHDIEKDDEETKIMNLLSQIPESYQRTLILHYLEGKKYEAIAETMSIPIGTVKTLLFRGKKMLRELYIEKYGERDQ